MKKFILCLAALSGVAFARAQAKDLVVYFSAQGHTQAVAEEIASVTGADILRLEAADPYAANPYNDSQRIQNEAYNDLRPGVANLPAAESLAQYDRLFVGSPVWWHQPAMVVCTFLEAYDLAGKTIVPFFTYGATTYLNESMHKVYRLTPDSRHVPQTLPEDLNPDDITTAGPADDAGIDMPANARGVQGWLQRLGLWGGQTAVDDVMADGQVPFVSYADGDNVHVELTGGMAENVLEVHNLSGALMWRGENEASYSFPLPGKSVFLVSLRDMRRGKSYSRKISL